MKSSKREWRGIHHSWSFSPQTFRWSGEMISGINFLPIATNMRAWMLQQGQLSLMSFEHSREKGGLTNPYTKSGITLSLIMASVIDHSYAYAQNIETSHNALDSEIERLRIYNELLLYSARLIEVVVKQLLYCTQIPESRYKQMGLGQLLESPCPYCKKKNGKEPHLVSLVGTLAHPYGLCLEFEHCAMDHMDIVNKLINSQAAHSTVQELNVRTSAISKSQLLKESTDILNKLVHMLSHIEDLEQIMMQDLKSKMKAINLLKLDGLKADDCNFNLVPGEEFKFNSKTD